MKLLLNSFVLNVIVYIWSLHYLVNGAGICSEGGTVHSMFARFNRFNEKLLVPKIYYRMGNKIFAYKPSSDDHREESTKEIIHQNEFTEIDHLIDFFAIDPCGPKNGEMEFCENSAIWNNLVVIIGKGFGGKKYCKFYRDVKGQISPFLHNFKAKEDSQIMPDKKTRLHAMMMVFFNMFLGPPHNDVLKLTGSAFSMAHDALYTSATVLRSDDHWNHGKNLLFRSNFTPFGVMQDSIFINKFEQEFLSLMVYGKNLFALTVGDTVLHLSPHGHIQEKFEVKNFFGCHKARTPLHETFKLPEIDRPEPDAELSLKNSIAFPYYSQQIKVIESSLITGGTFVMIVLVLVLLLVFVIAIDAYIIYSMSSSDVSLHKKSPILRRRSSKNELKSYRSSRGSSRNSSRRTSSKSSLKSSGSCKSVNPSLN